MINDVVIAGGGPNGLMLACELGLAGVRSTVLEELPGARAESRANGLVGQVIQMIDRRGLYERITGSAEPPVPQPAYVFGAMLLDLTELDDNHLYMLPVPQARLVELLAEQAVELGAEIRRGHRLTDLSQDAEAVTAVVDGPEGRYEIRSRYLVGADGAHSQTRKRSGIDFPGVTTESMVERTVNAVLPPEWIDTETRTVNIPGYGPIPLMLHHRSESGMFAYAPIPGRPPLVATFEHGIPEDTETPLTMEEMRQSIQRVLGVEMTLTPPPGDGPFLMRRRIGTSTRIADRFRDRRVLLLGDSAHVHSSIGGPGLNLGLQDTVNLGWKLAAVVRGDVGEDLLDTYEAERRPAADRVVMHTQAQSALSAPGPEVTALRVIFGEMLTDPRNVARVADTIAGADIGYEAGEHPLVGLFAPDLDLYTDGGQARLAQLTRDARPLLLDLTEDGLTEDGRTVDGPWKYVRAKAEGAPATALLLRPDTHVAWATSAERPDADEIRGLREIAARWFGRGEG